MKGGLAIYGTGAHARKACQLALAAGWRIAVFLDDAAGAAAPVTGIDCRAGAPAAPTESVKAVFVAIGNPAARATIMSRMRERGWTLPSLVHPLAWVSPDARIDEGVIIAATAVVETGAHVAEGAIIDIGALVDHDARVGAYCHVRPGQVVQACETVFAPPVQT